MTHRNRKPVLGHCQGGTEQDTNEKLGTWLAGLKTITTRMDAFYEKGGYAKGF